MTVLSRKPSPKKIMQIAKLKGKALAKARLAKGEAETLVRDDTKVFMGFTQKQLEAAFDLVKSERGWKYPINAVIQAKQQKVVDAAISYFAGGGAEFVAARGSMLRVVAPGYYMRIGS